MPVKHQQKPAPKASAPVEEHRKHADEFLAKEGNKAPKSGKYVVTDEAKP